MKPDLHATKETKTVIWFSRLLRWGLGILFVVIGITYFKSGGWPAVLFGLLFIITGFLRPKRCLDESCDIPRKE